MAGVLCLPPCSLLCGSRGERGKPSKSFCAPRVSLNNESYLASRKETRRRLEKRRRWQFSEPAERSRRREGGLVRKPLTDTWVERGDRGWARLYGALSTTGHPALQFAFCWWKSAKHWALCSLLPVNSTNELKGPKTMHIFNLLTFGAPWWMWGHH